MTQGQITKAENYQDEMGNEYTTYLVPVDLLFPGEDMDGKAAPETIDDYPIVIYANGEIQDGHHRYLYHLKNNINKIRVILAHEIDPDDLIDQEEWLEGLDHLYYFN